MKRERAEMICDHLSAAFDALNQASRAVAGLGKEERLRFDSLLRDVVHDLEDKLLLPICQQFPDLLPPEEEASPPLLCSEMTWDEVKLPPSVTEHQVDEIILSVLASRWQKTAMVVSKVARRSKELGWTIGHEAVAARLQVLSDDNRIESIGGLQYWGNSEVRLKDK